MTYTKQEKLNKVGACALASIREMVAALECDYDRMEELRDERDTWIDAKWEDDENGTPPDGAAIWAAEFPGEAQEFAALEEAAGECKGDDDARQRIEEDPLSIEYRTGWMTQRETVERDDWAEAKILLTTGGPAVQIIVELNDGEPHRAYLQVQDWGTPWTDYYEQGIADTLMAYVGVFCWE